MSAEVPPAGRDAIVRLRALLLEGGGLMASLVAPNTQSHRAQHADAQSPASIAASGPRAAGSREEYELLVEAIYEGYLLHYGSPRVVLVPDADLRLLAGDRLYAMGLARLVQLGDTFAVAELADTITLSALAQGAGSEKLADVVWDAGARAVGWGTSEAHKRAKALVAAGDAEGIEAMRTSTLAATAAP